MSYTLRGAGISALLMLTGGLALLPTNARAQYLTSPEQANYIRQVITDADSNAKTTDTDINNMSSRLAEALLNLSGQNTENANASMTAAANMASTNDQRAVMRRIEDAKYHAATSATSGASVCNVITGAIRTQNLEALTATWRSQAVQSQLAAMRGFVGDKPLEHNAAITAFNSGHCASSATVADKMAGTCPSVTQAQTEYSASGAGSGTVLVGDDENADLVLSKSVLTTEEGKAMGRFLFLVENPEPPEGPVSGNAIHSEASARRAYERRAREAEKSIGASILAGLIAQNQVISPSGDQNQTQALEWAEATAANVSGYATTDGKYFPNGISELAADELRAKQWYYNSTWGVNASSQGEAPTEKDMMMLMSWQTVQNFKTYKVLREIDMSLAAMESMMASKLTSANSGVAQ